MAYSKNMAGGCQLESSGFCEHLDELSGLVKEREYLHYMRQLRTFQELFCYMKAEQLTKKKLQ